MGLLPRHEAEHGLVGREVEAHQVVLVAVLEPPGRVTVRENLGAISTHGDGIIRSDAVEDAADGDDSAI